MSLTSHTKQSLIARAHTLHPIVIIGNSGLTQAVLAEIDRALFDHELIKIRLPSGEKSEKTEIIQMLSQQLRAESLKLIGHIVILYRKSDKKTQKATKEERNVRGGKRGVVKPAATRTQKPVTRRPKDFAHNKGKRDSR
jgi:RNA-binding protein